MSMVRYLSDERLQSAVAGLGTLPSMPELYSALMKELQDPNCSPRRIAAIVSQDPAMTAQILRLVNSSFFGLRQHVSSPEVAVLYLGTATIAALALGHGLFGRVDASAMKWARLDETWRHASSAGALAGRLARGVTDDRVVIEESVSGGLLHPIGKLVLACNVPQVYRRLLEDAERESASVVELERGRLGVTHSEIGAYLAGIWGLPGSISEAIAFHHTPRDSESRELGPLAIVHCACLLTGGCQDGAKCAEARPDRDYLREVDPDGRLGALVDEELEAAPAAEASE
jgi:HD-like signal output (HDOD) protein